MSDDAESGANGDGSPPNVPAMMEIMNARLAEMREAAAQERTEERSRLLAELSRLGVRSLEATYDGYGDSGNVEDITAEPAVPKVDETPGLADFLWSVAYGEHPGFENNEGGDGTVTWDLVTDRIDLDHHDNVVERVHSQSEDI